MPNTQLNYRSYHGNLAPKRERAPERSYAGQSWSEKWSVVRPFAALALGFGMAGLVAVIYLTAFALLTAHGTRISELDRTIAVAEARLAQSRGEVAHLTQRDRIEREAARLGLVQLPAGEAKDAIETAAAGLPIDARQVATNLNRDQE